MLCPGLLQLHFPFLVHFVSLDALFCTLHLYNHLRLSTLMQFYNIEQLYCIIHLSILSCTGKKRFRLISSC